MSDDQARRIGRQLPTLLQEALGRRVPAVDDLAPLSGGASSQLWSFSVPGGGRYVLRMAPPVPTRVPMTVEAAAITAARRAGVPAPAVVLASDDPAPLGAPFCVMEHVAGEARPGRILRDDRFAGARRRFASDCGRVLGALAGVDPPPVPGLVQVDQLARYRGVLDELGVPVPTFEWAFRALEADQPPPHPPALVHGDFRLGNLMLDDSGLRAVLDWELVHLGDPVEDLGWLCAKAWRFGADRPVGGIGERAELLDAYEEAGGIHVDPSTLAWWEAFSALKWGIICLVQASRHLGGAEHSVELAAIGRRAAETELDLLEVLGAAREIRHGAERRLPGGHAPASSGDPHEGDGGALLPPADPVYGTPTAAELLAAVRDFLRADVLDATSGHTRYLLRVAINVVDIVRRECEQRPGAEQALQEALGALDVSTEAELARAIRAGTFDDRAGDLHRCLTTAVRLRLAVSNPRYGQQGDAGR